MSFAEIKKNNAIEIQVKIPDDVKNLGKKIGWIVQNSLYDFSKNAAVSIRDKYLNGKALKKKSWTTFNSFGSMFSKKKQVFIIRPGLNIKGNQNYLAKWANAKNLKFGHNFVQPGFNEYLAEIERRIEKL